MSVRAPAEKNFRRPKVKPAKRKAASGRTWLTWRIARIALTLLVAGYAGYRAMDLVVGASTLQVRKIAVHGNVRISAGEVKALLDGLRGASILTADLNTYRRKLLESPWVEDVALRRLLPATVEVYIEERQPIGLSRFGGNLYLVDRHGTLIDEFGPHYAEFDLPIIDGLLRPPGDGSPIVDEARAELAARVIDAVAPRKHLAQRLSQIDVSDLNDVVVLLDEDPALLHLGTERFLERLEAYVELAPTFRQQFPEIDYVDLRFEERFYLRPAARGRGGQRGGTTPSPASRRF
jgi:cell division septal protein FtsQ